jgi:MerR HTH family regulatory protein
MQKEDWIPATAFCTSHNIEISFIRSLQESGLVEMTTIREEAFIPADHLQQLEKIVRLYFDMDINLEGIETITHLLQRMHAMQDEIAGLKNQLRFYETKS